jgi:hypothetical protein
MAPKNPVEISRKKLVVEALLDVSVNDHETEAVDLGDAAMIGLIVPPLATCNGDMTLTFEVSHNGRVGTFRPLYNEDGTRFDVDAGTAGSLAISTDDMAPLAAYRFVKIEIDCAQIVDATFYFVLKG